MALGMPRSSGNPAKSKKDRELDEKWSELRHSYIAKNDMLFNDSSLQWDYCHVYDFYHAVFGDGFLEEKGNQVDWDKPGGGRPNAIALRFTHETRKKKMRNGKEREVPVTKSYTFCDGLDGLEELCEESVTTNEPVFMAPVSYFGKNRTAVNARFLHAFAVDLDGVGVGQLVNILKQIRNGYDPNLPKWTSIPQPTFIVNSGTGVHLYYLLDEPVPLVPKAVPFLQEIKKRLTDRVWRDSTSVLKDRQYQGIYQAFRMPNTTTKLNGSAEGSKLKMTYEAVAFVHNAPDGNPCRCSLDYLFDYLGGTKEERRELDLVRRTGGKTPIEQAKKLWPEWYQKRLIDGCPPGRWKANRGLYDWWKGRIEAEAKDEHRYWCLHTLAAFADKCGVPYDELEADALAFVPYLESLTKRPDNHFTVDHALAAISSYGDGQLHLLTREGIDRRTAIEIKPSKRNGRSRADHLLGVRAAQKARDEANGTDWRNKNGAPTKREIIRDYAIDHPDANHSEIARALGVSRPTVIKWLREFEDDFTAEEIMASDEAMLLDCDRFSCSEDSAAFDELIVEEVVSAVAEYPWKSFEEIAALCCLESASDVQAIVDENPGLLAEAKAREDRRFADEMESQLTIADRYGIEHAMHVWPEEE